MPRRTGQRLQKLICDAEFVAELAERLGTGKALRAEFEEETLAGDGLNDAAGAGRGFDDFSVNASFAQRVGADEAGNATADDKYWDVTGHRAVSILARSERF